MHNAKERCRRLASAAWGQVLDDRITIEEYRNRLRKLGKLRYVIEKRNSQTVREESQRSES